MRRIALSEPNDFEPNGAIRRAGCWAQALRPSMWSGELGAAQGDLFADAPVRSPGLTPRPSAVPPAFPARARIGDLPCRSRARLRCSIACSGGCRTTRDCSIVGSDPDVHCAGRDWIKAVRRDSHKMKAFVRFRHAGDDGEARAVCSLVRARPLSRSSAPRRSSRGASPGMHWAILTPYRSRSGTPKTCLRAGRASAPTCRPMMRWRTRGGPISPRSSIPRGSRFRR